MSPITKSGRRAVAGMSIAEHLQEARKRLLIAFTAVLLLGVFAFIDYNQILHWLQEPYCRVSKGDCRFLVTGPLDGLTLRIKIAFFGGLLLGSPVVFYEMWRFITPGLKRNEKKYALPFVAASVIFFAAGCVVAYFSFEHALQFLQSIGGHELQARYNPVSYLNLIILMMVIFGITFEFPVVLVSLEFAGIVTPNQLLRSWRWALIGITIVAGVFTPSGDPFSMLALMVPLIFFYFASIVVGKLARR
jgi:sec-independent protein translocase protein TatC